MSKRLARFLLVPAPMRYLVLGAVLLFSTAGAARADGGMTDAVAAAFLVRNVDAGLHEIAHARVREISAGGELEHDGMRAGTAEVLAYNTGQADPIGNAVTQWIGSAVHRGILSDGSYGRIGCAQAVVAGAHWFACVLAVGPLPAQGEPAAGVASGTMLLPDTSMLTRGSVPMESRRRFVPR